MTRMKIAIFFLYIIVLVLHLTELKGINTRQLDTTNSMEMESIIFNDMRNAFESVTNDPKILNSIIWNMYNLSSPYPEPKIIFRIPQGKRRKRMIVMMGRSIFADPIFPNITSQRLEMMRKYWYSIREHNDENGGEGEREVARLENRRDAPCNHLCRKNKFRRTPIGDVNAVRALKSEAPKSHLGQKHELDVYIARANDPFGFSIKWQLKNSSVEDGLLTTEDGRRKRDVLNLYSMIQCSTGCDPILYKGYGCYCGFLGNGATVDGIDTCCKLHDKCYEHSNCISYLEYFIPYIWKCYRNKPLCAVDHGEWGNSQSCAMRLCTCDMQLSRCLRKFTCPSKRAVCSSSSIRKFKSLIFSK